VAELTKLETKLAEVTGLAMAAQAATEKVITLAKEDPELISRLQQMHEEAAETESRCTELAGTLDGKKTAILEEDSDALDGFEFLTMAEAGEVGHWSVLKMLNEKARSAEISELVSWALPIQENHYAGVTDASLKLAAREDPNEEA
jgi:hypothetical protein